MIKCMSEPPVVQRIKMIIHHEASDAFASSVPRRMNPGTENDQESNLRGDFVFAGTSRNPVHPREVTRVCKAHRICSDTKQKVLTCKSNEDARATHIPLIDMSLYATVLCTRYFPNAFTGVAVWHSR